jgi:hypothetical protein
MEASSQSTSLGMTEWAFLGEVCGAKNLNEPRHAHGGLDDTVALAEILRRWLRMTEGLAGF